MADPAKKRAAGLTPGKAVLIGVLAIVLVGVLYWQFSGANSATTARPATQAKYRPPTSAAKTAQAALAAKANQPESKPLTEVTAIVDPSAWKGPQLTEVTAYDPFATPAIFPKPQA